MIDHEDQELFRRSLRSALESCSGTALDKELNELGWHDALSVDPRTAVSLFFELQGATHNHSSAAGAVLAYALGLDAWPTMPVVLPPLDQWRAPGRTVRGELAVRGLLTAAPVEGADIVVVTSIDEREVALEIATGDLTLRPVHGMDPGLGLVEVTGDGLPFSTGGELGPGRWPAAVGLARRALGHELVGAARAMLELGRQHALQRIQFGRPIGTFQAIRHRLADSLVAIEAADAALDSAWESPSPQATAMAKAQAGRSARTVARHCQQVMAGVGFTTEHDLHLYIRRTLVLDELFGAARTLTRNLGGELLATRQLPPLPPL
jgi:Acyl-CoA dehydrogenase, C-terminal domain